MKKALLFAALLATGISANATVVSVSNTTNGPSAYLNDGVTLVPNGSLVSFGYLTTAGDSSSFVEFGTSVIATNSPFGGKPSKLIGKASSGVETDDDQFNGKEIYVWIYNAPTKEASTQSGLFRSNLTTPGTGGDLWVFKTNAPDDPNSDLSTLLASDINVALTPKGLDGAALGSPVVGTSEPVRLILGAAVVPEPTTATFAGLVGLLALARRRR